VSVKSYDHYIKNGGKPKTYNKLVGDPSYRYSREAKELFLKDSSLAYLFIKALPAIRLHFNNKQIHLEIIEELEGIALNTL